MKNATLNELRPYYNVFSDVAKFCQDSVIAIQQSVHFMHLNMSTNPKLCYLFLNAVVDYITTIYVVHEIGPSKKAVIGGYAAAYQDIVGITEPYFSTLCSFIRDCETPLQLVQSRLIMPAPKIAALILSLKYHGDEKLGFSYTAKELRLNGVLSLSNEVGGVKAPAPNPQVLHRLSEQLRDYQTIMVGLLACPNEIVRPGRYNNLFLSCLNYSNGLPLMRDQGTNFVEEYSKFNFHNNSKIKTALLREYLIYHLKQSLYLISQPKILATKFDIIQTLLSFSKDEIMLYFTQIAQIQGKRAKAYDLSIAELIWLLKSVSHEVLLRKKRERAIICVAL
ncbi:UNVERIFIED_CONTAM: Nck-associated protein 1-like [Siphonaria sp. JEL0065]|nr:Nck-associated protein 1-like [Siphonaria sp. JEL0065]